MRAGADGPARQHDGAVADPDVMANRHRLRPAPIEKRVLVGFTRKIGASAIGEMRLAGAVHRMVARIDPGHRRDRGELADRRVSNIAVVDDVRIIVELDLKELGARADLGESPEPAVRYLSARVDQGLWAKLFGHDACRRIPAHIAGHSTTSV
jgi:hypothetical protein